MLDAPDKVTACVVATNMGEGAIVCGGIQYSASRVLFEDQSVSVQSILFVHRQQE